MGRVVWGEAGWDGVMWGYGCFQTRLTWSTPAVWKCWRMWADRKCCAGKAAH